MTRRGTRVAAVAVALGFSMAGPQSLGLAVADSGEADGGAVSAGSGQGAGSAVRAERSAGPARGGQPTTRAGRATTGLRVASPAAADSAGARDVEIPVEALPADSAELDAQLAVDPVEVVVDPVEEAAVDPVGDTADGRGDVTEEPVSEPDVVGDPGTDPVDDAGTDPVTVDVDTPQDTQEEAPRDVNPLPWWRGGTDGVADLPGVTDDLVWAYTGSPDVTTTALPQAGPAPVLEQAIAGVRAAVTGFFDGLSQLLSALPASPITDFLSGALLLVRRALLGPAEVALGAAVVDPPAVTAVDPNQHVLLIGIDGTNLSAILSDPANQAFFDLMNNGTTGAATMVGHTTISNPGWTGILTGVWSETAGVSNNVFTPWTYDDWPTVFNFLETADPSIATTSIGNWSVIAQMSGAGSLPADTIVYYPEINGSWLETDDAVGARSVQEILDTAADSSAFQMTYFVGVDETSHDNGGADNPEYAEALRNVNDNIADMLAAIDTWEAANPGEEWTVIVVTDHGQALNAPLGLGLLAHGFQTPSETTVFVIADGGDFRDGAVNNTYSQLDVTPTILRLFGQTPEPYFEGRPLMDRAASDYFPALPGLEALKNALSDAIDMYGYPDVLTNIALGVRTIVASVPYFIYTIFEDLASGVPDFLALPVLAIGAVIYNLVNIPVQLLVKLTGVTGNDIIPPQWWPYNPVPGTQPVPPTATVPAPALAV